jgi:hypothetical protein
MKPASDAQRKALPRSWAFHPAGELHTQILCEYLGRSTPGRTSQKELFKATKKQFIAAGETTHTHLRWREEELLLLCLEILGRCEYELNPGHPYFTESTAYEENENDDDSYIPPIREPKFTRADLEETAADWYLKTKRESGFKMPHEAKHAEDCDLPESVQYYRWQQDNQSEKTREDTILAETKPQINETLKPREQEQLTWDDVEGKDLNNHEVCRLILEWLNDSATGISENDRLDSIKEALKMAQRTASKEKREEGKDFPIRLRIKSDYLFHRLAMIQIGATGGKSSTYKRIIESKWGS